MKEDLSGPYPGYGFGALDAFDGYVSYRLLDEQALANEIAEMKEIIDKTAPDLVITQDLGLGMMLWMTHFFPEEGWAELYKRRSLAVLDRMWIEDGYFCRESHLPEMRFAFTNYGVSIGLQAADAMLERVERLNAYVEQYRSGDECDRAATTHVMACNSHFPGPDQSRAGGCKGALDGVFWSCGEGRRRSDSRAAAEGEHQSARKWIRSSRLRCRPAGGGCYPRCGIWRSICRGAPSQRSSRSWR